MSSSDLDGSDETGEGYFASVSDLMVGILFVFLLMLTIFALNFRDEEDNQKVAYKQYLAAKQEAEAEKKQADQEKKRAEEARAEANNARIDEEKATQKAIQAEKKADEQRLANEDLKLLLRKATEMLERDAEERQSSRNRLILSLEKTLRDRNIQVSVDPNSGILRLSGDLLFDTGKSNLKDEARQTVMVLAEVLGKILPGYSSGGIRSNCPQDSGPILETLLVEGHTDHQPYKKAPGNQSQELNDRLSTERALTVFQELWQSGTGLDGLRNADQLALLGFSGYGDRRPLADAQGLTEADYKKNRRIDLRFVLTPKTSDEFRELKNRIDKVLETQ